MDALSLENISQGLDLGLVDTDEGLQQLREEIFIMCQLDHPNIVRLEEVYESTVRSYIFDINYCYLLSGQSCAALKQTQTYLASILSLLRFPFFF